ncbi:MAG: alpha/beta hydrolase fold domain-containing protein [Candidatus Eremiobacteraeota bacterium]|nr:alpha/beta hydrolase fold domain-containing protein [Candidatus Eremiobacteraeota bacterium]
MIPSYRLYPSTRARGSVADAAAAVAWTLKNIARYGGSPQKICVGHSAGGYLAATLVFDPHYLRDAGLRFLQSAAFLSY